MLMHFCHISVRRPHERAFSGNAVSRWKAAYPGIGSGSSPKVRDLEITPLAEIYEAQGRNRAFYLHYLCLCVYYPSESARIGMLRSPIRVVVALRKFVHALFLCLRWVGKPTRNHNGSFAASTYRLTPAPCEGA